MAAKDYLQPHLFDPSPYEVETQPSATEAPKVSSWSNSLHDFDKPTNLPFFMTGSELMNVIDSSGDLDFNQDMGDLWEEKKRAARGSKGRGAGIRASLKKHGWDPVEHIGSDDYIELGHLKGRKEISLTQGHHRIAAAADLEQKGERTIYIPVSHAEGYGSRPEFYRRWDIGPFTTEFPSEKQED